MVCSFLFYFSVESSRFLSWSFLSLYCLQAMTDSAKPFTINWQPNAEGLNQILALLRDSQSPNPSVQQRVNQVIFFQSNFTKMSKTAIPST